MQHIRSVLVHLDATAGAETRLRVARQWAALHEAAVTALFAVNPGSGGHAYSFSAAAATQKALQQDVDGRAHMRALAEALVARGGAPVNWLEATGISPLMAMASQALYADLLVLGQRPDSDPHADQVPSDFAERIILASGRPALVLPHQPEREVQAHTILIAWKPSREAARAVTSALPLLKRARAVHVVSWAEPAIPPQAHTRTGAPTHDIVAFLHGHGVTAQWHQHPTVPKDMGQALATEAKARAADLLVMGCYGHSRTRELVMGGASRSVMQSLSVPVWMAH